MRHVGSRAGFFVVPVGLVFAAYQVEGWKMPRLLAAFLIAAMLTVAGVALLSIVWETIKEIRRLRERRETSTAWISNEPPGALDFVPDMNRAARKFNRQMGRLTRDTARVGRMMTRQARVVKWVPLVVKWLPKYGPRVAQLWANHTAKRILRSAIFIEKRTSHLRATIDEFTRAQEGQLANLTAPSSEAERVAFESVRTAVTTQTATTDGAINSVGGYRDTVRGVAQQNFSRALRVSGERLADQLDAMIVVLRRFLKDSERLEMLLERKLKA